MAYVLSHPTVLFFIFSLLRQGSLCSPAHLEFKAMPAFASCVLGLKSCTTTPSLFLIFKNVFLRQVFVAI